jgi:hypothetical protein
VAGNNWGVCEDATSGNGCGPQETFRGCADIEITHNPILSSLIDQVNVINLNTNLLILKLINLLILSLVLGS